MRVVKTITSALLGAMLTVCGAAHAGVIFDNSVKDKITVTWDETFTLNNSNAGYFFLVYKNVFATSDGSGYLNGIDSMVQTIAVNGGAQTAVQNWYGWQFRGGPEASYDEKDLLLGVVANSIPAFNSGDTIRWVGSQTVNVDSVYRMPDVPVGTPVNAYVANYQGTHSNLVISSVGEKRSDVPEPGSLALIGLGLAAFGFGRRKFRA